MNNQLIEQLITVNDDPCPEFTFENPLLDKNVAKALSKSLVNILSAPEPDSKVNNDLRVLILENLRKMCKLEPESHMKIDEDITSALVEAYERDSSTDDGDEDKMLEECLIRNMKDMDINSSHRKTISPEVLQALINLNENRGEINRIYEDIIHVDIMDNKAVHILKQLWLKDNFMVDDASIKLKSEIEKVFLDICNKLLNDSNCNVADLFVSNTDLKNIVTKSSVSATCFQLSCRVLHYLFLLTNFSNCMQMFIQLFVENVKQVCTHLTISVLYPTHLCHIALLLDIAIQELPMPIQTKYAEDAIKYMQALKSKSETDFVMLLSHFPQWFDIIPQ